MSPVSLNAAPADADAVPNVDVDYVTASVQTDVISSLVQVDAIPMAEPMTEPIAAAHAPASASIALPASKAEIANLLGLPVPVDPATMRRAEFVHPFWYPAFAQALGGAAGPFNLLNVTPVVVAKQTAVDLESPLFIEVLKTKFSESEKLINLTEQALQNEDAFALYFIFNIARRSGVTDSAKLTELAEIIAAFVNQRVATDGEGCTHCVDLRAMVACMRAELSSKTATVNYKRITDALAPYHAVVTNKIISLRVSYMLSKCSDYVAPCAHNALFIYATKIDVNSPTYLECIESFIDVVTNYVKSKFCHNDARIAMFEAISDLITTSGTKSAFLVNSFKLYVADAMLDSCSAKGTAFEKIQQAFEENKEHTQVANVLFARASSALRSKKYKECSLFADRAIETFKLAKRDGGIALTYCVLADASFEQGNYGESKENLEKAIPHWKKSETVAYDKERIEKCVADLTNLRNGNAVQKGPNEKPFVNFPRKSAGWMDVNLMSPKLKKFMDIA